jgi:hypothetical protein
MPRYTAKPVLVEAFPWQGHAHELPESFRMAITRHLVGGMVEILTGDGARQCRHDDWIVRGPDGQFSVLRAAAFETYFEPHVPKTTLTLRKKEAA